MYNLDNIKSQIELELGDPFDLTIRQFSLQFQNSNLVGLLFFIRGIVNEEEIEETVIGGLQGEQPGQPEQYSVEVIARDLIQIKQYQVKAVSQMKVLVEDLLNGRTVIVFEGREETISAETSEWVQRAIDTPESQRALRGPQVAFNENLLSNISLVRGIIKNPNLTLEKYSIGSMTNTEVCIVYLRDLVDPNILREVKGRIESIDASQILDSNYVEDFIHDEFKTPFPLILNSDRPDVVSAEIMSRKIAIMVNGSAYVLIGPAPLMSFFNSSDDYYLKWNLFFTRIFRFLSIILSVYIPAFYIALCNFQPGFLPFDLLISLAGQRENKPLPLVLEVLLFTFILTIIIESAMRLQKSLVLTISLLGTIVIGQAAIEAGIVQPATLVIVSISYILGFATPVETLETPIRMMRYSLILASAFTGMFGIFVVTIFLIFHLAHLRTFGVPYLAPIAPFNWRDQKDTFIRFSLRKIASNPKSMHKEEPYFRRRKK